MLGREVVDFNNPDFCARCGKRNGDHLTDFARRGRPKACPFVKKLNNVNEELK